MEVLNGAAFGYIWWSISYMTRPIITRNLKLLALCLTLLGLMSTYSKADHIIGSDFSYKCSSTNDSIYEITYNFYRDCNGCYVLGQSPKCGTSENCASSSTAPTSLRVSCTKGTSFSTTLTMKRTSISDITKTCKSVKSRCAQPCNGTFPYGIEKHVFEGTLDLRQAIKQGCCNIEISALLYVRNVGITTGQSQQPFFTSCEINVCDAVCNTSPTLTNDPVAILCCNQPYVFNNGAVDFSDNDSISYSFVPAYRSASQQCTYSGQRTPANPISTYFPTGLKFPYSNPNANPPIGTYLDPQTGDIIFTPTKCGEIAVVVIEMTEWRKDTTGKYKKIGVTRRDMQFIVMSCPGNNPPRITNTKFTHRVCEATQICFTITTDDQVKRPPPPATPPPPDTVELKWNRGIPGATFTILNPTARLKQGRFCWTPPEGTSSTLPYTFTATVTDDACPLSASATRAFQIYVDPKAEAERDIDTFDCGKYSVNSTPFPNFKYPAKYLWELKDTAGNIIFDRGIAAFQSTGSYLSTKQSDTIQFRRGGTYIIQHTIENKPKCPFSYYDTLVVPPLLEVDLAFGPDTFICAGTELKLEPEIRNSQPPVNFLWGTGDTTSSITIQVPLTTTDTSFYVEIKDKSGCTAWDSTQVFLRPNPYLHIGPDRRICPGDTINILTNDSLAFWNDPRDTSDSLIMQGDTLFYDWTHNGQALSTDTALYGVDKAGQYILHVIDSLGCRGIDTIQLYMNDTIKADAGIDRTLCEYDWLELVAKGFDTTGATKYGTLQWWDITNPPARVDYGDNDTVAYSIRQSTTFELELVVTEDTTTCSDKDTAVITVNPLPTVNMPPDMDVCFDAGVINLRTAEDQNASGGTWSCPGRPNMIDQGYIYTTDQAFVGKDSTKSSRDTIHYVYIDPTTGCVKHDSFVITVNPLPTVELRTGYFCQDKEVVDVEDDKLIKAPGLATLSLGRQAWKCVNCGSYDESKLIYDANGGAPGASQDFKIRVDDNNMPLGSKTQDSIFIEFEFRNVFGCYNRDTGKIIVTKVPEITFSGMPELCWDEGIVELKKESGVLPNDGIWRAIDSTGFANAAGLNAGLKGDTLNEDTLNTLLTTDPGEGGTLVYMMEYYHDRSGCPTSAVTPLTIHGLPEPLIDRGEFEVNNTIEPYLFCESNDPISLQANYSGGVWSSSESSVIVGGDFDPGNVTSFNTPVQIRYDFTNSFGCSGSDSVEVIVHKEHVLNLPNDTNICRTENMSLNLRADFENTSGVNWIALSGGTISDPNADQITFSFSTSPDSSRTMLVYAQTLETGTNVCPFVEGLVQIHVHPKPKAIISGDTLNGCTPVDVNFSTAITNQVDPATSTYKWSLPNNDSSSISNPYYQFTNIGTNTVDLTITSINGCDTTLSIAIDVYPIPLAGFTPDPNNSTTAALPKFTFNNESTVDPALSSQIIYNFWDFGVSNALDDTSNDISPIFFYPSDTGTYNVTLTVRTQYGCESSISGPVIIGPDLLVYIPTAFSPDDGGPEPNEGFRAIVNDAAKTYHIIIFNRWGEVIWESQDPQEEWYGTYGTAGKEGKPVPQDVYAYYLQVESWDGNQLEYSGTVTLIR